VVRDNEYSQGNSAPQPENQIPASEKNSEKLTEETSPAEGLPDPEKSTCRNDEPVETKGVDPAPPPPAPPASPKEKVSGLSLASIRKKKELLAKQQGFTAKAVEEKNEKFNETQLHAAWDDYIHRLKNKGEKILASIMETDMPKLSGTTITIELPADTMKKDLERGMNPLMGFLKKKLQNTFITLEIDVNETKAKQYAFTNIEKFNKLKEKNPLIEKLRTTFDLDL
jgi:DNA polymerase III subunit gamma/tau